MRCHRCGSANIHLGTCKSTPDYYECFDCKYVHRYPDCTCGHMLVEWPHDFTMLFCAGCGNQFPTQPTLQHQHVTVMHGRVEQPNTYDRDFLRQLGVRL